MNTIYEVLILTLCGSSLVLCMGVGKRRAQRLLESIMDFMLLRVRSKHRQLNRRLGIPRGAAFLSDRNRGLYIGLDRVAEFTGPLKSDRRKHLDRLSAARAVGYIIGNAIALLLIGLSLYMIIAVASVVLGSGIHSNWVSMPFMGS